LMRGSRRWMPHHRGDHVAGVAVLARTGGAVRCDPSGCGWSVSVIAVRNEWILPGGRAAEGFRASGASLSEVLSISVEPGRRAGRSRGWASVLVLPWLRSAAGGGGSRASARCGCAVSCTCWPPTGAVPRVRDDGNVAAGLPQGARRAEPEGLAWPGGLDFTPRAPNRWWCADMRICSRSPPQRRSPPQGVLDLASVLAAHRGEAWDERISERGRGRAAGRWDGAKCLEAFLEEIAASSTGLRSRASPARRPDRGRDSRDPLEG